MGHRINHNIFRAYDIRGVVPDSLNPDTAELIGVAFGNLLDRLAQRKQNPKCSKVMIATDHRRSGKDIKRGLRIGLRMAGYSIVDIGVCSTPEFYFTMKKHKFCAGVMVTASHNPSEYNGMKFMIADGIPLSGETGIYEMRDMIDKGHIKDKHIDHVLKTEHLDVDVHKDYIEYLTRSFKVKKKVKVIIDTGNGVVSTTPEKVLRSKGCEARTIFAKRDCSFPNHIADPSKTETLAVLQKEVIKSKADMGFAFDGDGDRVGLVDDRGRIVETGKMLMLLQRMVLAKKKGKIVYGISVEDCVLNDARKRGGKPVVSKTGHSYIVHSMLENDAIFGVESSGHIFFRSGKYCFDDGLYAALKLAEIASYEDSLAELIDTLPWDYPSPEIDIMSTDEKKFSQVERLAALLKKAGHTVNTIDGVRVVFPKGWALVRASNTTPHVKCKFEGRTHHDMIKIVSIMRPFMEKAGLRMRKSI